MPNVTNNDLKHGYITNDDDLRSKTTSVYGTMILKVTSLRVVILLEGWPS